jgi:thiosulfate reductase cytochrome b subunit
MPESTYLDGLAVQDLKASDSRRHSAVVRLTHWITAASFFALMVSGIAVLISHPRLYWGETGSVETPSLMDLPLPFVLANQNGWGRYLHFQSAWVLAFTGLAYMLSGVRTHHFQNNLLPSRADLQWRSLATAISDHVHFKRPSKDAALTYNVLQRISYLAVIFGLFPLMIWTGLAMSPALTSVFPVLVTALGGQQSARTIHFFGFVLLVLFVVVHIVMVSISGFGTRVLAMITGGNAPRKEHG